MSILPVGIGSSGVDVGDIGQSLRFRSSASAYLSRTPGSAGNRKTWTWSGWVKRSTLGTAQTLFDAQTTSPNTYHYIQLTSSDTIQVRYVNNSVESGNFATTTVYRDTSAHLHVCVAWDATQATAADRIKLYVNGAQVAFTITTNVTLNADGAVNNTISHFIGCNVSIAALLDGYLSRVCFVDGTALTPSSFGYLNTEINEWVSKSQSACKAVVDAGGTNSFMLDFDNGSSLTTLGYDKSSKGNNWTLNGHSLTAGPNYDWMNDVPGNSYAVLNPLDSDATISNANLQWVGAGSGSEAVATISLHSGKWYWECFVVANTLTNCYVGVGVRGTAPNPGSFYRLNTGEKQVNGTNSAFTGTTATTNDLIGVAYDADTGAIEFFKNGSTVGTFTNGSLISATVFPEVLSAYTTAWNFGQRPFAYTPPTGFQALCQANLPSVAITNPKKHFDVVTRTGTGANTSITGKQFQPDFVWAKSRSNATSNELYDSVRGVNKLLVSDSTAAEDSSQTILLTSFNSDGYSLGSSGAYGLNILNNTYVDWLWKAGGTAVTNTAGSITSTVSANTTAGFSIVTYTGTGANATVGHGLGVAPKMVIVKSRSSATAWIVQHASLTSYAYYLRLETTIAQTSDTTMWNSTGPSSSVFSLGTQNSVNASGATQVAYCFAEIPGYSKFGSYAGNGSADGPFVFCGFKPKYVLVKSSTTTDGWRVYDSTRPGYNVIGGTLLADTAAAETTAAEIDFTSNGFKLRVATTPNAAQTYIFAAFADVPFKYANAR